MERGQAISPPEFFDMQVDRGARLFRRSRMEESALLLEAWGRLRKERGVHWKVLCAEVGLPYKSFYRFLSGKRLAKAEWLMAGALGMALPPAAPRGGRFYDPEPGTLAPRAPAPAPVKPPGPKKAGAVERKAPLAADETRALVEMGRLVADAAREDVEVFSEYVMRDEKTGAPWELATCHRRWQRMIGERTRLVLLAPVSTGKTMTFIARVLWEIGRNQNLRCILLGNAAGHALKIARTIRTYIEQSEAYHEVFPEVQPGDPWGVEHFTVKRPLVAKEPTVQAAGRKGNILGSRSDFMILDDIEDYESTRSEAARNETYGWFKSEVTTRRPDRIVVVATAWHNVDLPHRLIDEGWSYLRDPILDDAGHSIWPERWTPEAIASARRDMGPLEYARAMLLDPVDEAQSRFSLASIQTALALGEGVEMPRVLREVPPGHSVFTGVDLAVGRGRDNSLTSFATVLLAPDGRRRLLDLVSGRLSGIDIVRKLVELYARYHGIAVVENVGAFDLLVQFTKELTPIPVWTFTTTAHGEKHLAFQAEKLAVELSQGLWIVPSQSGGKDPATDELQKLIRDLVGYRPSGKVPDRMSALLMARHGCEKHAGTRQSAQLIDLGAGFPDAVRAGAAFSGPPDVRGASHPLLVALGPAPRFAPPAPDDLASLPAGALAPVWPFGPHIG